MNSPYYSSVKSQITMALDANRNSAYLNALEQIITPDSVVLDLGAGLGTLGLYAAKLGAKHVYFVEPEPVIKLIPKLAQQNALDNNITCLRGTIEEIDLPEKVDLIISVFTGNFLLEEDLLSSLFYARDHCLKETGTLLPNAGEMWMVPISDSQLYSDKIIVRDHTTMNLDISAIHQPLTNSVWPALNVSEEKYLCSPQRLIRMDFENENSAQCNQEISFTIEKSAACHGFIGWLDIDLNGRKLSTAPSAPKTHWTPLYFPCESAINLTKSELLTISIDRLSNGPWVWSFKTKDSIQRLSTLKALLDFSKFKHNLA